MAGTFTGTWRFMSPERIKHHAYSYPSDVWSLGISLLQVATGSHPYGDSGTYLEMASIIVENPPPDPSGMAGASGARLSPEFCAFVEQCLQKDPEARLPADVLLAAPWLQMHGANSAFAWVGAE